MMNAKFKKGEKVRVTNRTLSPFKGRIGVVCNEPIETVIVVSYLVQFESDGKTSTCLFDEALLEAVPEE
jgi:hypothetical protein